MNIVSMIEKAEIGKVERNPLLSKYTTYKVGGKALAIVYPKNVDGLIKLLRLLKENDVKYKILGNGSNLLFSDSLFEGIIIKLSSFDEVEFFGNNKVRVGAGYSLIKICIWYTRNSWGSCFYECWGL